ncbi:hypothetical protein LMIY3S_05087 [Labrys miyagiensis]
MTTNDDETTHNRRKRRKLGKHRSSSSTKAVAEASPRSSLKENAVIEMPAKPPFVLPPPTREALHERGTLKVIADVCAANEMLENGYRVGRYHLLAWALACANALQETEDDWHRFIEEPWWRKNNTRGPRKSDIADTLYFVLLRIFGPGQHKLRSKYLALLTRFKRGSISPDRVVEEIQSRGGIEKAAYPPQEANVRARAKRELAADDDKVVRSIKSAHQEAIEEAAKQGTEPPLEITLENPDQYRATATENGVSITLKVDGHQLDPLYDLEWHALNVKVRLRPSGELQLRGPFFNAPK